MRRTPLVLLLLALAGCSAELFAPGGERFHFAARALGMTADAEPSAAVVADAGAVRVEGLIPTPTPCQSVTGALARTAAVLTLTVSARSTGAICPQATAAFAYEATLRDTGADEVLVRVVHTYPGTGLPDRTVVESTVVLR